MRHSAVKNTGGSPMLSRAPVGLSVCCQVACQLLVGFTESCTAWPTGICRHVVLCAGVPWWLEPSSVISLLAGQAPLVDNDAWLERSGREHMRWLLNAPKLKCFLVGLWQGEGMGCILVGLYSIVSIRSGCRSYEPLAFFCPSALVCARHAMHTPLTVLHQGSIHGYGM